MTDLPAVAHGLHVRRLGRGARQVLAFHCTMAHSGALRGLAQGLGAGVTVTAPDMPSHGRSPDWDGQDSVLDRVIEAGSALLSEPMDLIGHSFGGVVALHLAVQRPELVRSLVLFEPVFFAVVKQDQPEVTVADAKGMQPVHDALAVGDPETAARVFNALWGAGGTRWRDLAETTRAAMTRGVAILADANSQITQDPHGLLRPGGLDRVTAPALLLRGAHSPAITGAANTGLARRLPDAVSTIVEGTGHMAPLTDAARVADEITRFWSRV
ncbi:MAG: alpha/beta fold hydrolase [Paracoccaceae bacterium]